MNKFIFSIGFLGLGIFAFFSPSNWIDFSAEKSPYQTETTLLPPPEHAGEQGQVRWFFYNGISGSSVEDLDAYAYFPQVPSGVIYLTSLETIRNFNDQFGTWIRGYILPDETGTFTMNITGDDRSHFYLSTDDNPANMQLIAQTLGATSQHETYPEQTYTVDLTAGNYYYFEIKNKEGGGGDYVRIYWKKPSATPETEYQIIHGDYLFDYAPPAEQDVFCNPPGTACDDGNPNTSDDRENGLCQCYGQPNTANACIGERGQITAMYYDGLAGTKIIDMEEASIFPDQPTRIEQLLDFSGPYVFGDNYGTYVRLYLTVPETGLYTFNITGDDETKLWLSSGESYDAADLTEICHISGYSNQGQHDKYPEQTSDPIMLSVDNYYYMELKVKEGAGGDHFGVFWKTPSEPDAWKLVNNAFVYGFKCETACFPQGSLCNDGDPTTSNDRFDENCECVGTPCGLPDCSEAPNYVSYQLCDASEKHSNNAIDSWLSCQTQTSPYIIRPNSHWILYDLNELHQIFDTKIWNYNVQGETGKGFKQATIDFSADGINWVQRSNSEWPQADGTIEYDGFFGPDFGGQPARYILITGLTNWNNDNCAGFSEMVLNAAPCPDTNTPCDDGNTATYDDKFDENCICAGINDNPLAMELLGLSAEWEGNNVLLNWKAQNELQGAYYEVQRSLDAQSFDAIGLLRARGLSGEKTAYELLDSEGGKLANELFYRLKITEPDGNTTFSHTVSVRKADGINRLSIQSVNPNPFQESVEIQFTLPSEANIQVVVFDGTGRLIRQLVNERTTRGQFQISWDGKDEGGTSMEAGIYYIQLTDGRQRVARKVMKL